ncbi:MAG: hypothetical protein EXX96DRAFT_284131 [Benjaminiella poitrasii]|nr:MAG: hypothetical protein EXX96DRAFT_284131 [Benjaminiella poitrasii]
MFFQIRQTYVIENTAELARIMEIHPKIAQKWVAAYETDTEERKIPFTSSNKKEGGRKLKLTEEHTKFIKAFFEKRPLARNSDLMDSLYVEFEGQSVSKTTLYRFMKENCNLSYTRVHRIISKRNDKDVLRHRKEWVLKYAASDMEYLKNCVFLDEAGFNLHFIKVIDDSKNVYL